MKVMLDFVFVFIMETKANDSIGFLEEKTFRCLKDVWIENVIILLNKKKV